MSRPKTYDVRKQSVYFGLDALEELRAEAKRQDRSISWLVNRAWQLAKAEISTAPTVETP